MKKSFVLYTDTYEPIKGLSQEEKGELLDAIFIYQINQKELLIFKSDAVKIAFAFFKAHFIRDGGKWKEIRKERKIAGKKGGLKRAENERLLRSKSSKIKQTKANQAVSVSVSVSDNNINNNQTSSNKELTSSLEEIKVILDYWNELYGTNYKTAQALESNFTYWRKNYSVEEIKTAIKNIQYHKFWADKMNPILLFRLKNKNKESVQYIEDLLNINPPKPVEYLTNEMFGNPEELKEIAKKAGIKT